jgi:hypothetical protein
MYINLFTWGKSKQAPLLVTRKNPSPGKPQTNNKHSYEMGRHKHLNTVPLLGYKKNTNSCCSNFSEHFLHRHVSNQIRTDINGVPTV